MAVTEHSEHVKDDVAALGQAVKQSLTVPNGSSEDSQKSAQPSPDLADDAEIQHVQEQLRALNARADAMEAEATKLAQESSGSASTEAEQARNQAAAMRGAATQAQSAIAAAPTDTRTGKKRISAAKLSGISSLLEHIITEAEQETRELGTAIVEVRANNAKRTTARGTTAKPNVATRLAGALTGSSAAGYAASHTFGAGAKDDDAPAFSLFGAKPLPQYVGTGERKIHADKYRSADDTFSRVDAFITVNVAARVTDKKAAATAAKLYEQTRNGTREQRDVAYNEMADAVGRHVLGRTFLGQEIDDAVAQDAQLKKQYNGWVSSATTNIISALEANGALTSGYSMFNSYEANRAWSARNVRRIDENADGQISAQEIKDALRDARAAMARANAAYEAKARPKSNPNQGKMVTLDGFGQVSVERARDIILSKDHSIKVDKDGNGTITYAEGFAAVAQWNATHAANGQSLAPSSTPARQGSSPSRAQKP